MGQKEAREKTMHRTLILTTALLVLSNVVCVAAEQPQDWQAGAAKVNITPREPMWMAGYASRNKPADGTLTELWAKSLVLMTVPETARC